MHIHVAAKGPLSLVYIMRILSNLATVADANVLHAWVQLCIELSLLHYTHAQAFYSLRVTSACPSCTALRAIVGRKIYTQTSGINSDYYNIGPFRTH